MNRVSRRQLAIDAASLSAVWWLPSRAQAPVKPYRVGFASPVPPSAKAEIVAAMADLGLQIDRDWVLVDSGVPYGSDIELAAARIVAQRPDVIVVVTTAHAVAVHRLTQETPIVMIASGYPVEAGLARSLARPGKNVTGNAWYAGTGIWGKLLQLLHELKPGIRRIGLLWDYVPPAFVREEGDAALRELREDARAQGLEIHLGEVAQTSDAAVALATLKSRRVEALLVTAGPMIYQARERVMDFAIERRWPTVTDAPWFGHAGPTPMLVYGPVYAELRRQSIGYVARILRGAKPGELPILLPSRFEFEVNLKAARAIGLALPQSLLLRADRVIE